MSSTRLYTEKLSMSNCILLEAIELVSETFHAQSKTKEIFQVSKLGGTSSIISLIFSIFCLVELNGLASREIVGKNIWQKQKSNIASMKKR